LSNEISDLSTSLLFIKQLGLFSNNELSSNRKYLDFLLTGSVVTIFIIPDFPILPIKTFAESGGIFVISLIKCEPK